jgi:hypothetical protein
MLAGRRGPEEIKRLLDFEHDNFCHLLQDWQLRVFAHRANSAPQL